MDESNALRLRCLLLCAVLLLGLSAWGQRFHYDNIEPHPRLLLKGGEEEKIRRIVAEQPTLKRVHERVMGNAKTILSASPIEFKKEGQRLPTPQFDRLFVLAYAYRMTGDKRYVERAEREIRTSCAFPSWNPSHFLDAATMAMALAVAYDWMYDAFSPELRALIRKSIVEKAFLPARDKKLAWFYRAAQNWNQVCNAGLVFGAIAIMEDEPEAAMKIIEDCMGSIGLALKTYAPDGVYPEGYGYWNYGTGRNVLLNAGLETAFGSDYGLSEALGFLESARFIIHMVGPTGHFFNYADSGTSSLTTSIPWMLWFAQKTGNPSLLYWENGFRQKNELAPNVFTLILSKDVRWEDVHAPKETMWVGHSDNSVALIRTEWDNPDALYLAVKAGAGSVSHAHLDVGSFVFEAGGVRWAIDLGADNYLQLESAGVDLWNISQNSGRWDVYRQNNRHHNTLTVNGQRQLVKGRTDIEKVYRSARKQGVSINLTPAYETELRSAVRDIAIVDKQRLEVKDVVRATNKPAEVEWNLMTPADPVIVGSHEAILKKDGKELSLVVESPRNIQMEVSSAQPEKDYETPNPGISRLSFRTKLKGGEKATIKVRMELR